MRQPTFYPSRIWTFAIWVSSFLMAFYNWLIGPFYFEDFHNQLVNPILHGLSLYLPLLPFYFLFIIIAHYLLKQKTDKKLIKIELSFLGFIFSIIIGWIHYYVFGLSLFSGITFFISLLIGIWFYKIDHHKVTQTYNEELLDEKI